MPGEKTESINTMVGQEMYTASATCWNTSTRSGRGPPVVGRWWRLQRLGKKNGELNAGPANFLGELVLAWGKSGDERSLVLAGHNRHVGAGQGSVWRGFIVHPRLGHCPLPTDTPWDCGDSARSLRWEREFAAPVGTGARVPRGCGPHHGKGPSRGASHLLLAG